MSLRDSALIASLTDRLTDLDARVKVLEDERKAAIAAAVATVDESRRGPGRPRKDAAA